jgi:hypothetical protein
MKARANSIRNSKSSVDQSDHEQLAVIGASPERNILPPQSRATQRGVKFFLDFENIKAMPATLTFIASPKIVDKASPPIKN